MRTRLVTGTFSPALFARWYGALMIAGCFGWPLVLGIGPGLPRYLWLAVAVLLVGFSIWSAYRSAKHAKSVTYSVPPAPFLLFVIAGIALGIFLVFPVTFFGDEDLIALPSLIIASKIATYVTWPGLAIIAFCLLWIVRSSFKYLQNWHVWVLAALFLTSSIVLAVIHTHPETLTVRYPSFVHFLQFFVTVFTQGSPEWLRMGNVFWVITLGCVGWYAASDWPPPARIAMSIALCLTPLGWTYHILFYQACGELTIGLLATILLGKLLHGNDSDRGRALIVGSLFSFWILYRPTSLILAVAAVALLFVFGRRRAAWTVGSICLPIGALWLAVYGFGSFQYPFLSTSESRSFNIVTPLLETLKDLPNQIHIVGILFLVLGGMFVAWKRPTDRYVLLVAWVFAVAYTAVHQILTIEQWYGYGRFSALLMLPLAVTVGSLVAGAPKKRHTLVAVVVLVALALITPWSAVEFLQSYRADSHLPKMERTVTGGVSPSPLPRAMEYYASKADTLILLSPHFAFLDLLIARGKITVGERTAIIERSRTWTPASTARPVLIQPPTDGYTYRTNITEAYEKLLLEAAEWAHTQSGMTVYRLGNEEALVVP